jgi:hypothetical protein
VNATLATVALISAVVAAGMTTVVVRMVWLERRRSAARVAALSAEIHGGAVDDFAPRDDVQPAAEPIGGQPPSQRIVIGSIAVLGAVAAMLLAVGTTRYRTAADVQPGASAPQAATAAQALELVALDHEASDDHLTVRGVVRNPAHGSAMDHLTAVVLLFNQQGRFLTSGRVPVETTALEPGAEATFVITVPGAADVGRYRVSFRTDDRVVPHVDRRRSRG